MTKYATVRSQMLDFEDAEAELPQMRYNGSTVSASGLYRAEIDDPQVSNASQSNAIFELMHTFGKWNQTLAPLGPAAEKSSKSLYSSKAG